MLRFTVCAALCVASGSVFAQNTALFLGNEYQAQAGSNAGSIRGGDPATDATFASFLATANLTTSDLSTSLGSGNRAVWGTFADPGAVASSSLLMGGTSVGVSIVGWDGSMVTGPSGNALLDGFGADGTTMQAGAPRPGFASGTGSGSYIGTINGNTSDGIRNAVRFDFSSFAGGGVYAFGLFGGDLETGAPGSPLGFLRLNFTDGSFEDVVYAPDTTILGDASFSSTGNNESETYGNETGRFVGLSNDFKRIASAVFVVGDDDMNDTGDSEQLSFIAPMTFLDASGAPVVPMNVPTPGALVTLGLGGALAARRRR